MSTKGHSGLKDSKETKAEKTVRSFEDRVRDDDMEHLMILDREGNVLDEVKGNMDEVSSKVDSENMISSHNHPKMVLDDGTEIHLNFFSVEDLESFAHYKEFEMRMVTSQFTYSLRRKSNDTGTMQPFYWAYQRAYDQAYDRTEKVVNEAMASGKIPNTESSYIKHGNEVMGKMLNKWLRNHADKYGFEFTERSR